MANTATALSPAELLATIRSARSEAADASAATRDRFDVAEAELHRREAEAREVRFKIRIGEAKVAELKPLEDRVAELKNEVGTLAPAASEAARVDDYFREREDIAYRAWQEEERDRARSAVPTLYADALVALASARDALGRIWRMDNTLPGGSVGLTPARTLTLLNQLDDWVTLQVEHGELSTPGLVIAARPEPREWPGAYDVRRRK